MDRHRAVAVAAILSALLVASGCSRDEKGMGDSPVGDRHEAPRQVWLAPDQYPNIAAWCIGVNGVYATTRQGAPPVIVTDDPNCQEGGVLYESGGEG